jgi:hypothetical protein
MWIRTGFNANLDPAFYLKADSDKDPDPAFYLKADSDKDPDPGSQTDADPDPGQTSHKKLPVMFTLKIYIQ